MDQVKAFEEVRRDEVPLKEGRKEERKEGRKEGEVLPAGLFVGCAL
jgi:hypothetical protein